jgi:hypothetical protein
MIITELNENQQKMLEQLQQKNGLGLKNVFVTAPIDLATWSRAGKPSCWQLQEEKDAYTLFVDHAWGKNALFDGTTLIEMWTFHNVVKSFPQLGFVIIQDNESQFNSWFFIPANDL